MTTATMNRTRDETEILALLAALRQAHRDKDGAYVKDAAVCDLSPPLVHRGVDAKAKQAWLDTWDGPVELETPPGTLTISGDLAVHHGLTRMSGKPKMAPQPISFWLRDTIVLKRGGDGWRIAHVHSSVPFHMDGSLRPAFDLQP
jgi:ketosteroid isomerase-like protein